MPATDQSASPVVKPRAKFLTLDTATVADVMHRGVFSCPYETPLSTVARLMATHRVHFVVGLGDVTEDDTRLWGVISDRDVLAAVTDSDFHRQTAGGSAATPVVTVSPDDPLRRAAELMRYEGLTHAVVVEPGTDQPVGVVSTLDIAAVAGGVATVRPRAGAMRVQQLMSSPAVTVPPDLPVKDLAAVLVEHGITAAPVVAGGEVVGVVSEADIVALERGPVALRPRSLRERVLGERRPGSAGTKTAADVMTSPAITIAPWQQASSAAALMTEKRVKRLPVVQEGKLLGVVSRSDLLRAFARTDAEIERDIREEVVIREFMLPPGTVRAEVRDGNVTLRGAVDNESQAELMPRAVRRVPGVVSVTSALTVRAPRQRRRVPVP